MKNKTVSRILAAALSVLLLAGCAQSTPQDDPPAPADPGESVTDPEPVTEPKETRLELGFSGASTSDQEITVNFAADSVNTVLPGIFGANVSWRGNGYGQWDPETNAPDATLLEMLKNSGVTHMRYPGGIEGDYFHWNESIGEDRLLQVDPFSSEYPTWDDHDGVEYMATFGPDEFLELCKAADNGVTIQLNAGNGTPEEAADWVRHYLEKNADVWSFCVGNEVCMDEERVEGMTVTCTPQEYVEFYNKVYEDLGDLVNDLEFGAIGITPSHKLCKYRNWDYTILSELGDKIDFIDVHIGYTPYFVGDATDEQIIKCLLATSQWVRKLLDEEIDLINKYSNGNQDNISIQITEWGPISKYSRSVAASVYMASFLDTVLAEPKVSSACYLPLINHYNGANLLGALVDERVTGEKVYWENCNSYVFRWYAEQTGRSVLNSDTSGGKTFDAAPVGLIPAIDGVREGEAAVYYDQASRKGTLFVVNKSYEQNTVFHLNLPFETFTVDAVTELWNEDSGAYNDYSTPDVVAPSTYEAGMTVSGGRLRVEAKPVSILKIDFSVAG